MQENLLIKESATVLCPRLKQIEDSISLPEGIADIGTDHAHLLISLAKDPNHIKYPLIGTEISQGPFMAAQKNIERYGLATKIDLRLGDGLNPIEAGEVTSLVISGMGGHKIIGILEKNLNKAQSFKHLYLQPHRDIYSLRKWLLTNKFRISHEAITKENSHYYFLLVASPGEEGLQYTDLELQLGRFPLQQKNPLLKEFLKDKINSFLEIQRHLKNQAVKLSANNVLDDLQKKYCEVLKWL